MFCEKCGTKLEEEAKFCTNCGANIAGGDSKVTIEKNPDTEIQLRVKPTFKLWYMILPSVVGFCTIILILSFMMGMISAEIGFNVFGASIVVMAIILGIMVLINKKQYESYCYDFYKTKVIYRDSFINLSEKEVKYKYIREVTMRQTFIQRYFNIGNIVLFTNAETGYNNGICIISVENVKDVYKKIKDIIDL